MGAVLGCEAMMVDERPEKLTELEKALQQHLGKWCRDYGCGLRVVNALAVGLLLLLVVALVFALLWQVLGS